MPPKQLDQKSYPPTLHLVISTQIINPVPKETLGVCLWFSLPRNKTSIYYIKCRKTLTCFPICLLSIPSKQMHFNTHDRQDQRSIKCTSTSMPKISIIHLLLLIYYTGNTLYSVTVSFETGSRIFFLPPKLPLSKF